MAGFNPGDVFIDTIMIVSPRSNSWNMAPNFISGDVLETIFSPSVTATIHVFDDSDYLGNLQLAGDELVNFTFRTPNGVTANYSLHLNSVKNVEIKGAMKSKTYELECLSREAMTGQANYHQKSYNTTIDSIIQDIFGTLGSSLGIQTESTKGQRNWIASGKPYDLIETLRKEAVSMQNKSSNFMFWQTWKSFYFQSLEYMLQQGDVKEFIQTNTIGHDIRNVMTVDQNILAWKVIQNMDAMNRIHAGVIDQRISTYDSHTHKFVYKDFNPKVEDLTLLGSMGITTLSTFTSLFSNAKKPLMRTVNPNQKLQIGQSNVPDVTPYKSVNLAQMQEQLLHMTVIGDPNLEPGKTITNNVPKIAAFTGPVGEELQVSGRWLISKTHHEIRMPDIRPRYISNLECLKGAYQG
jgi:hypothetical protein